MALMHIKDDEQQWNDANYQNDENDANDQHDEKWKWWPSWNHENKLNDNKWWIKHDIGIHEEDNENDERDANYAHN